MYLCMRLRWLNRWFVCHKHNPHRSAAPITNLICIHWCVCVCVCVARKYRVAVETITCVRCGCIMCTPRAANGAATVTNTTAAATAAANPARPLSPPRMSHTHTHAPESMWPPSFRANRGRTHSISERICCATQQPATLGPINYTRQDHVCAPPPCHARSLALARTHALETRGHAIFVWSY